MLGMVALASLGAAPATGETLKFAHVYETSEPYHKWALWAADEIKKRTAGRYDVQVFPSSSLGKEQDLYQGLQLGSVDMVYTGSFYASRDYGPMAMSSAPYMFRDYAHWASYRDSPLYKEVKDAYTAKTGNEVLALIYYGERHVTSNKPIRVPADMKGMKFRTPDSPMYTMFPRAMGANPTPIAFAEVYLALQNGTVDAQENPLTTIEAKKFYEVQKNIILTGHIVDSLATQVAPHVWTKLSDADKKVFVDVTREAATKATEDITKREKELAEEFKKKGIAVTPVDKKSFQDAIMKTVTLESMGYSKADWDKIQAIK